MGTIDGTAWSEVTIDGQAVQEITVDGSVVWNRITESLTYYWYDTQSLYNSNSHPTSESQFDNFFDSSRGDVSFGGSGTWTNTIHWGDGGQNTGTGSVNSKPSYLPAEGYSWKVEGYIIPSESGTYSIGIDGDDAIDVFINNTNVANWYDGHGFDGNYGHNGNISLTANNKYSFKARMEEGGGGDGISVVWKTPSNSSWSQIPTSVFTK